MQRATITARDSEYSTRTLTVIQVHVTVKIEEVRYRPKAPRYLREVTAPPLQKDPQRCLVTPPPSDHGSQEKKVLTGDDHLPKARQLQPSSCASHRLLGPLPSPAPSISRDVEAPPLPKNPHLACPATFTPPPSERGRDGKGVLNGHEPLPDQRNVRPSSGTNGSHFSDPRTIPLTGDVESPPRPQNPPLRGVLTLPPPPPSHSGHENEASKGAEVPLADERKVQPPLNTNGPEFPHPPPDPAPPITRSTSSGARYMYISPGPAVPKKLPLGQPWPPTLPSNRRENERESLTGDGSLRSAPRDVRPPRGTNGLRPPHPLPALPTAPNSSRDITSPPAVPKKLPLRGPPTPPTSNHSRNEREALRDDDSLPVRGVQPPCGTNGPDFAHTRPAPPMTRRPKNVTFPPSVPEKLPLGGPGTPPTSTCSRNENGRDSVPDQGNVQPSHGPTFSSRHPHPPPVPGYATSPPRPGSSSSGYWSTPPHLDNRRYIDCEREKARRRRARDRVLFKGPGRGDGVSISAGRSWY